MLFSLLIVLLFFTSAVYTTDQTNPLVAAFARFTDLPAARINHHIIGFGEMYSQFNAIRLSPEVGSLTRENVMNIVKIKIRREYAARDLARDLGAMPSKKIMKSLINEYMSQIFGTTAEVQQLIRPLSFSQFKRFMIAPIIIEQQIAKKIILDEDTDAYTSVKQFYDQVNADPTRFESLYALYAQEQDRISTSTDQILSADDLSVHDASLLRSITEGHITPIIASFDGYRIYKVLHYFTDPQEAWQVQELFMSVSIEDKLNHYMADQSITSFAPHAFGTTN